MIISRGCRNRCQHIPLFVALYLNLVIISKSAETVGPKALFDTYNADNNYYGASRENYLRPDGTLSDEGLVTEEGAGGLVPTTYSNYYKLNRGYIDAGFDNKESAFLPIATANNYANQISYHQRGAEEREKYNSYIYGNIHNLPTKTPGGAANSYNSLSQCGNLECLIKQSSYNTYGSALPQLQRDQYDNHAKSTMSSHLTHRLAVGIDRSRYLPEEMYTNTHNRINQEHFTTDRKPRPDLNDQQLLQTESFMHNEDSNYLSPDTKAPLPPVTTTVRHTLESSKAVAGLPLQKHIHVTKNVPVTLHEKHLVPYNHTIQVPVPRAVIAAIPRPTPIKIPISKTIAIPQLQEVKIPVEKVKAVPIERPVPFVVERRVPYRVEKQVATPIYYPYPVKVPVVRTIIHKHPQLAHSRIPFSIWPGSPVRSRH